jgi:radical SAM superfamily enzyme YgiQ (UPF0313 family)
MTGNNKSVLLITGFAPLKLPQLLAMGIPLGPIKYLSHLAGKNTLKFSIPTVAPAILGSYLQKHGVSVRVMDYFLDDFEARDTDIAGISSTFMGVEDVQEIANRVKTVNPTARIVLGGPLSWSLSATELMTAIPALDYILVKEGEQTFAALIEILRSGGDPEMVANLVCRRDNSIVTTPHGNPLCADDIPQPDWTLLGIPSAKRLPVLPVETSRGCPFDCAYCSETTYWGKPVRYRRIDDVIDELEYNVTELGISVFRFTDSCFSAPPVRCAELCEAIYERLIQHGLPVKWSSYARVSNLDEILLGKMKMAGCVALDIGVESGSEIVLRAMGRHYAPEAAVEVARTARNMDIITNFNVVVGFPGETRRSMLETADLINSAAPDTYSCFQFFLAPNTRVETLQDRYHLEGQGLDWQHDTMNSAGAKEGISMIESRISNSANFPGGEYFACYLASVGYTVPEIRTFYRSIKRLAQCPADNAAQSVVAKAVDSIGHYW